MADPVTEESNIAREKQQLFRLAAVEAIKNSHKTIKSVWMILFTGGTFALLNSFDHVVECKLSLQSGQAPAVAGFNCQQLEYLCGPQFLIYLGLIVVYVLTFYRFYVGNIRVFDIRYNEAIEFIKNLAKVEDGVAAQDKEYDWLFHYNERWKVENIYLIFKTLVIIYLTVAIISPLKFEFVFLLLLVMDIIWIASNWVGREFKRLMWGKSTTYVYKDKFVSSFKKLSDLSKAGRGLSKENKKIKRKLEIMFPVRAMSIWGWNNFVWGSLLLFILIPFGRDELGKLGFHIGAVAISPGLKECLLIVGLAFMLANCLFDLLLTWGFYNPQYRELNDYLFERQEATQHSSASGSRV